MAENFECFICQGVLQVPYECPGCHRNFCQEHINQLGRCPLCHRQNMPYEYKHNYSLEQKINDYPFSCSKGCGFKSNNIMELERHIAQCNGFPSPAFSLQDPYSNQYQGNQINQYGSTDIQYNKNMYPSDAYGDIYSSNVYTPSGVYNTNPTTNYQSPYDYNFGNSGSNNIYSSVIYGGNSGYPKNNHNTKIFMSPVRSYNTVIPSRSNNLKKIIPVPTINIRTPNSSRLINSPRVVKLNRRGIGLRPMSGNQRRILSPLPVRSRLIGGRPLRPFSRLTVSVIH